MMSYFKPRASGASALLAMTVLAGCSVDGPPPANAHEARIKADFVRDRDRCRGLAERTTRYVDPRDGDAVADRSYRVEGEIQRCMLSRGWNNPEFDGWAHGRY